MSMVAVYGLTVHALALCALGCILLGLSLVDLETYTIPNGFIIAGIAAWAVSFAFYGVDLSAMGLGSLMLAFAGSPLAAVLLDGLLGAFVVAGCLLALSLVFDKVMGRRSLGGGDVSSCSWWGCSWALRAACSTSSSPAWWASCSPTPPRSAAKIPTTRRRSPSAPPSRWPPGSPSPSARSLSHGTWGCFNVYLV